MIERVYRQASKALDQVIVATDDSRIADEVERFGGKVVMTSPDHRSGTDRCQEAYAKSGSTASVVINIQGDEPFIDPSQLETLKACFDDPDTDIATLARPFDKSRGFEALFDPNLVKLTRRSDSTAIYFSRSIIPYVRNHPWQEWLDSADFLTHIGLYAYRGDVLKAITKLPQSALEISESLEQLRWIENGYRIKVGLSDCPTIGIDTPDDLENARKFCEENGL
jgi:3-deoxy-manno-octulosonate cytidylyltransferase (CMP-KDO synthetase)